MVAAKAAFLSSTHNIIPMYVGLFRQRIKLAEDLFLLPQPGGEGGGGADLTCLNQIKDGLYVLKIQLRLREQHNPPAFHYYLTQHLHN